MENVPGLSRFKKCVLAFGRFFFRYRNTLFPGLFALLFLFTRPALFLGREIFDRFISWTGIFLAFSGQAFRLLVIGYAYIKRGGKDGKVYADDLVVEGLYRHTRNPMYFANFMIVVGLSILYGAPAVFYLVIPFFAFVYGSIVVTEETYLRERFGSQYEVYTQKVNRFWPEFRGLRRTLSGMKYDWKKALRKDYGTLFGLYFGTILICFWKMHCIFGFQRRMRETVWLAVFLAAGAPLYLLVRFLKKTGRLKSQ
jgi:protein-S-isoprenylcysteine O-methyltransferase Ste14